MNNALRTALTLHLGNRVSAIEGDRLRIAPANLAELKVVIGQFRSHGASLRTEAVLDRRAIAQLDPINAKSAFVTAQAGVTLEAIDRAAGGLGLSIGPLSPGARALPLAGFLEGPYAGLRAVLGGRLEPMALSLEAILESGLIYQSRAAPRSAAGPDLDALLLGGEGRLGWIASATIRLVPKPAMVARSVSSFPDARSLTRAARRMLAAGCDVQRGWAQRHSDRYVLELELGGSSETIERDRSTCSQLAADSGGRSSGRSVDEVSATDERELSWEDVAAQLDGTEPLALFRLATDAVIATGASRGVLISKQPWADEARWSALARAALEPTLGAAE